MLASFLYVLLGRLMALVLVCFRSSERKELEIVVLRVGAENSIGGWSLRWADGF